MIEDLLTWAIVAFMSVSTLVFTGFTLKCILTEGSRHE